MEIGLPALKILRITSLAFFTPYPLKRTSRSLADYNINQEIPFLGGKNKPGKVSHMYRMEYLNSFTLLKLR